MKIPQSISSYNKSSLYGNSIAHGQLRENADTEKIKAENNNNIKRPVLAARSNGSERIETKYNEPSFTGDPKLVTHITKEALNGFENGIPNWAKKMGGANWFKTALNAVDKNEARYEAFMALFVAGLMKPAFVLMMPGAEKEDKRMAATKNSVSALIGFGLSNLILSPCSDAVNKITKSFESNNPTKYVKDLDYISKLKSEELLPGKKSTLGDAFKTAYKKVGDLGVSPMKAALTIALTPFILKFLFGKEKSDKKKKKEESVPLQNSTVYNAIRMEKNTGKVSFTGNRVNGVQMQDNAVSFTGLNPKQTFYAAKDAITAFKTPAFDILSEAGHKAKNTLKDAFSHVGKAKKKYSEALSEPIAKAMGLASGTKAARRVVEGTAHFEKPSARWADLTSFVITFFYLKNTYQSETMDEDRKLPLMINNVMVTAASSIAAALIDKYTDKPMENLLRGYLAKFGDNLTKKAKKNVEDTLNNAINKPNDFNLESLTRHSDELLEGGIETLTDNMKNMIKELEANDTVQEAIKKHIINNDDIAKMAVSSFESQASKIYKNISKAKSLTIFTFTVRFLVTVLMTPVIGRVVAFVNKKLGKTKEEPKKPEHLDIKVQSPETLGIKDFMSMVKK